MRVEREGKRVGFDETWCEMTHGVVKHQPCVSDVWCGMTSRLKLIGVCGWLCTKTTSATTSQHHHPQLLFHHHTFFHTHLTVPHARSMCRCMCGIDTQQLSMKHPITLTSTPPNHQQTPCHERCPQDLKPSYYIKAEVAVGASERHKKHPSIITHLTPLPKTRVTPH